MKCLFFIFDLSVCTYVCIYKVQSCVTKTSGSTCVMELIDYELNFISGLSTNMKEVLCVMELIKCKEFEL